VYNERKGADWLRQRIKPKSNLLDTRSIRVASTIIPQKELHMATFKKDPKKPAVKKGVPNAKPIPMVKKKIYKTKVGPVKKTKK